jgi:hypothetical protein
MAVSRPLVLALIGAVLMAATFMVTREPADDGGSAAPAQKPAPAAQKPAPAQKPEAQKAVAAEQEAAKREAAQAAAAKQRAAKANAEQQRVDAIVSKLGAVAPGEDPGNSVGVPMAVARALAHDKTVLLFFSQDGADDNATLKSVRSLRGNRHVAVFTEDLDKLPNYRRIVAGLDVAEAPSIVIVGHDLKARLLEGYHDAGSLRQHVRDLG